MSTFIHNEATSLSILQELKIPEAFLARITSSNFPVSAEVAIVIPHAFGAICLNEAGLSAFSLANPVPQFLKVFLREDTMTDLLENDVPHIVGTALDELVRHHPSLKPAVLTSISELMDAVLTIGRDSSDELDFCQLFLRGGQGENERAVGKFSKHLESMIKVGPSLD